MRNRNCLRRHFLLTFFILLSLSFSNLARCQEIKISGTDNFKIKYKKAGSSDYWELQGDPSLEGQKLTTQGTQWTLIDNQNKTLLKSEWKENNSELNIFDAQSKLKLKVKKEVSVFRYFDANNKLIMRSKDKGDKTNIYDANEKRIYKVKAKTDSFSIKDALDNKRSWKVKGVKTMSEAAVFALPISAAERSLIWRSLAQ